jgi:hypothetical protein
MDKNGFGCKGLALMAHRLAKHVVAAGGLLALFTASAMAYGLMVNNTNYVYYQDPENPSYAIARQEMRPVYEKFPWDTNPLIGIAEVQLDRDEYPELIAFPTEEPEQVGDYCRKSDGLCPHYVLQIREQSVRTLGVIFAHAVSRGNDIQNGYWTLSVYLSEKDLGNGVAQTYVYDSASDSYKLAVPEGRP